MIILPDRLIPRKRYKFIDLNSLRKGFFLVRRSICAHSGHKDLKKIDPKCFIDNSQHWVKGISCNLLGIFSVNDLAFQTREEQWLPCSTPKKKEDISTTILENSLPIFIDIEKIHNQHFPYEHSKKIENETPDFKKKLRQNKEEINKLLRRQFQGSCMVVHKPTLGNFWHFEIYFSQEDGNLITVDTLQFKTLANSFIQSFLLENCKYSNPQEISRISKSEYHSSIPCFIRWMFKRIKSKIPTKYLHVNENKILIFKN